MYAKDIAVTVPTGEKFKLSFLFDVSTKPQCVCEQRAIAVDIEGTTVPVSQSRSFRVSELCDLWARSTVSAKPVASARLQSFRNMQILWATKDGTAVNAKVLSSYLSGRMILAYTD